MKAYTVILSADPDVGGFVAIAPAMPGAATEAETRQDVLDRIVEVMALWMEVAAEDGYGPRQETPELVAKEVAAVLQDRAESGWDLAVELVTVVLPVPAAA